MLTLYDAPRCPYCARARIVLAEKDIPYETVEIDLSDRPAWLYEKNPSGKVPVLEDDGWVLPESAVIAEYLEERFPEPALLPADPAERAVARLLVFRFDDFSDPYYALRRGEDGAAEVFADGARAHRLAARAHAVPDGACLRAGRHRLRAVGDSRARAAGDLARRVPGARGRGWSGSPSVRRSQPRSTSSQRCPGSEGRDDRWRRRDAGRAGGPPRRAGARPSRRAQ